MPKGKKSPKKPRATNPIRPTGPPGKGKKKPGKRKRNPQVTPRVTPGRRSY